MIILQTLQQGIGVARGIVPETKHTHYKYLILCLILKNCLFCHYHSAMLKLNPLFHSPLFRNFIYLSIYMYLLHLSVCNLAFNYSIFLVHLLMNIILLKHFVAMKSAKK